MTKESLRKYCKRRGIEINFQFGLSYPEGQVKDPEKERQVNFMALTPFIEGIFHL
jgi:hypothetical protein